jgi:hypothetical protein
LREKWLQILRKNEDAFGLQRAANPGDGLREVMIEQIDSFSGPGARRYGTLEKIGEQDATFLEVGKDFSAGLPCRGDGESGEEIAGEAGERSCGRVEKLGVGIGNGGGEQQSLDVDGAETRGPFEALQAASNVLGGSELAAAIARQKCRSTHIEKW